MKTVEYTPHGVCAHHMTVSADGGTITNVEVIGGCSGNLNAITVLLKGMKITDAIAKISGITCGSRDTSCPDQLSVALKQLQE